MPIQWQIDVIVASLDGKVTVFAAGGDAPKLLHQAEFKERLSAVETWRATGPGAPPRAMVLEDSAQIHNPHVFRRGNPGNQGEEVPRRFLRILAGDKRQPFQNGSGRLELARAIASADNPLTSRVFVNRVWMHHFGTPIVGTPGDFGRRSDPPSNPELLDHLAHTFVSSCHLNTQNLIMNGTR